MSPVAVTVRRTLGQARGLLSTAFACACFQAAVALQFSFNLDLHEGGRLGLATLWTASVSPWLPVLASLLTMGTWSDERLSGRAEVLLASPVREGDLVLGKFLGALAVLLASLILSLVPCLGSLFFFAPAALGSVSVPSLVPGVFVLLLQGTLWCAVGVAVSALTCHAACAACASLFLLVAVPRAGWQALLAWAPGGRPAWGEMPLDAHALDFSSGVLSTGTVAFYLIFALATLFVAVRAVSLLRRAGCRRLRPRLSAGAASLLALVFAGLAVLLAVRLDVTADLPFAGRRTAFSQRMRGLLAEAGGRLTVTGLVSRKDPRFRETARFLRALKREADASGGVRATLRFVDPHWDLGAAERLMRLGAVEGSVVFERGRRVSVLPLADGCDERRCMSAIRRVTMPPRRRTVCWTFGHGETSCDDYGAFGLSDIARDLVRDGYRNVRLDLTADSEVPQDCALVVIAGAREDFSRAELGRLDAFLKRGGRMLVLLRPTGQGGVASLLPGWGVRATAVPLVGARTFSGSDVVVSEFTSHAISAPLTGSQIVLERPVTFQPSAATDGRSGADRLEYAAVARVGDQTVAAAVERGAGAGRDLALRPTRLVVVGDVTFVQNGPLAARANANRDFFMNSVAFLAGTDAAAASGAASDALILGLSRNERIRLAVWAGGAFPVGLFLLMALAVRRRRRRG